MSDTSCPDYRPWTIFLIFLRLGMTSFGGPVAHLGYFRNEFVIKRHWLSERSYVDLVALCQFLPGPASSQVGIALGLSRGGYLGAVAAWTGFTAPSAIALILFALGISSYGDSVPSGVLQGFKVVAVAVVAQAVWGMARNLCTDTLRITIMVAVTCFVLLIPSAWAQVGVIAAAGVFGAFVVKPQALERHEPMPITVKRSAGLLWLFLFFVLLLGLSLLSLAFPGTILTVIEAFYRTGSLVFGGGHVVLPLLQAEVVESGWVDNASFLAGYGIAQAVPGPLFTFAAFLGASMNDASGGWLGGLICLLAIFAPSFLLVFGALPFWENLRANAHVQTALSGINAAVVGLLLAALYQPVWTSAVLGPREFGLALIALIALISWKLPPWLVVLGGGLAGWAVLG